MQGVSNTQHSAALVADFFARLHRDYVKLVEHSLNATGKMRRQLLPTGLSLPTCGPIFEQ